MIASKYCAFREQGKKPTLSAFALWDGRKAEITDQLQVKKEAGTNLLNEVLYLLTQNIQTKYMKKKIRKKGVKVLEAAWPSGQGPAL